MELSAFFNDILIVIVLYRRKPANAVAFTSTERMFANLSSPSIFIYDNSPEPSEIKDRNVIYRHDPDNNGVSKAYNEGCREAERNNKKWLLLADQDTEFHREVFMAFRNAVIVHPEMKLFAPILNDARGIVSPFRLAWGKGFRLKKISPGVHSFTGYKLINSAMLISAEAFRVAGGFDERFPLDLSDIVFCERFQVHHPEFVLVNAHCGHSLSSNEHGRTLDEDMNRFLLFNRAMRLYKKLSNSLVLLGLAILPRGILLSIKYRDLNFIKAGLRSMITKP